MRNLVKTVALFFPRVASFALSAGIRFVFCDGNVLGRRVWLRSLRVLVAEMLLLLLPFRHEFSFFPLLVRLFARSARLRFVTYPPWQELEHCF